MWENSAFRDMDEAKEVEQLAMLNYFDEEFLLYITSYVEDGRIKYRLNENQTAIYQYLNDSLVREVYPLPTEKYFRMVQVNAGDREQIREQLRTEIVAEYQRNYPQALIAGIQALEDVTHNDLAYELMREWKKSLAVSFSAEEMQLFDGALRLAYEGKHLTKNSYQQLKKWVEDRKNQIRIEASQWKNRATFYGFCFERKGKWVVFSNAVYEVALEQREKRMREGKFCTPLLSKSYWTDSVANKMLQDWRMEFENELLQVMDGAYMEKLQALREMPSVVDVEKYDALLAEMQAACQEKAVEVLRLCALKWNLAARAQ